MRKSLASLFLLSMLSACGSPDGGYYDNNGNWIANNPYAHRDHPPLPGGTRNERTEYSSPRTTTVTTYHYDRRGYYDRNGYYMARDSGLTVADDMFPPRGMCRVWFPDRAPIDQPGIESCTGIQNRVPAGAYVIYGG